MQQKFSRRLIWSVAAVSSEMVNSLLLQMSVALGTIILRLSSRTSVLISFLLILMFHRPSSDVLGNVIWLPIPTNIHNRLWHAKVSNSVLSGLLQMSIVLINLVVRLDYYTHIVWYAHSNLSAIVHRAFFKCLLY